MPNFTFTSPDGKSYTVSGPEGATQEQAFAILQQQLGGSNNPAMTKQAGYQDSQTGAFTPIQNAGKPMEGPEGSISKGLVQGAYNVARQGIETPIAGLAGLGASAIGSDPEKAMQSVMGIGNWTSNKPKQEATNQAIQNAVGSLISAPQKAVDYGTDITNKAIENIAPGFLEKHPGLIKGQAAVQGIADVGANLIPAAFAPKAQAKPVVRVETPFSVANKAGFSIIPSEASIKGGSAPIGTVVEGLAGSAKAGVDATLKNQKITNSLAAREIGIKPGTPLTSEALDAARAPHNAVYSQVAGLSKQYGPVKTDAEFMADLGRLKAENNSALGPNADIEDLIGKANKSKFFSEDLVKSIKSLRKNAASNYKASNAYNVKNANELGDLADAQKGVADAFENLLDRYTQNTKDKGLITKWQDARKQLAKINTIDNAIKEGTTDVSARMIAKQLNKGAPLSGHLKTIGDAANAFPISMQDVTVRNKVPINALEGIMGTAGTGAALFGHNPTLGAAAIGGMVARPLARHALLSDPYQALMNPRTMDPRMLQLLSGGALTSLEGNNLLTGGQ